LKCNIHPGKSLLKLNGHQEAPTEPLFIFIYAINRRLRRSPWLKAVIVPSELPVYSIQNGILRAPAEPPVFKSDFPVTFIPFDIGGLEDRVNIYKLINKLRFY